MKNLPIPGDLQREGGVFESSVKNDKDLVKHYYQIDYT